MGTCVFCVEKVFLFITRFVDKEFGKRSMRQRQRQR